MMSMMTSKIGITTGMAVFQGGSRESWQVLLQPIIPYHSMPNLGWPNGCLGVNSQQGECTILFLGHPWTPHKIRPCRLDDTLFRTRARSACRSFAKGTCHSLTIRTIAHRNRVSGWRVRSLKGCFSSSRRPSGGHFHVILSDGQGQPPTGRQQVIIFLIY
jgi:hypothetical protein